MDRIDSQNVDTTLGYRRFKDGPPGTTVVADFLNALQEEIISCITASGQTPDKNNFGQLWTAISAVNSMSALPVGAIFLYGSAAAPPQGWLLCDGSLLAQADYGALFGAIGSAFNTGGEGVGQFRLPDFRGVFPKGAGATTRAAGVDAKGNAYAATLGVYVQDQMQWHRHLGSGGNAGGGSGYLCSYIYSAGGAYTAGPVNDTVHGPTRIGNTTEPQSVGINFIIKY